MPVKEKKSFVTKEKTYFLSNIGIRTNASLVALNTVRLTERLFYFLSFLPAITCDTLCKKVVNTTCQIAKLLTINFVTIFKIFFEDGLIQLFAILVSSNLKGS